MTAGARQLDWLIACHQHWRQARAVQHGLQSARDPDTDDLVELGDGVRVYSKRHGETGPAHSRKALIDGWWRWQ
jgi:hypothetical protein